MVGTSGKHLRHGGGWNDQKLEYMHNNPVEAGFVREPEQYEYSSAGNYAGTGGRLKVISVYDGVEIYQYETSQVSPTLRAIAGRLALYGDFGLEIIFSSQ